MYRNVGGKIKMVAKVYAWIGIVLSVLVGVILLFSGSDSILVALIYIFLGPLLSWLSSLLLYGFGQLIDNTDRLAKRFDCAATDERPMTAESAIQPDKAVADEEDDQEIYTHCCSECGRLISTDACPFCGNCASQDADDEGDEDLF